MTPKEKAIKIVSRFHNYINELDIYWNATDDAKACAKIAVENEYNSTRELLFNLKACKVIESEKVYLTRIQQLIDEEKEVTTEIDNLPRYIEDVSENP
jgi:hypothetical protein